MYCGENINTMAQYIIKAQDSTVMVWDRDTAGRNPLSTTFPYSYTTKQKYGGKPTDP